jgi:hypothetical protein
MATQSKSIRTIQFDGGTIEEVHPANVPGRRYDQGGLWYYCVICKEHVCVICKEHVIRTREAQKHIDPKYHDMVALCIDGNEQGFYRELQ